MRDPEGSHGARLRQLYLWRHAKAVHGDMADFERSLTGRGHRDAELVARWMAEQEIEPDEVLCSPARRTTETWNALRRRLGGEPVVKHPEGLYGASAAELLMRVQSLPDTIGSVLVVGHNPGLEQLALELSGPDSDTGELAALQLKFPTGAVVVLETAISTWSALEKGTARLVKLVRPRDLR